MEQLITGDRALAQVLASIFKLELTISCCNAGGGNGPSLDCAVREEHGHPKGEKWSLLLLFGSHFSLVMLVL